MQELFARSLLLAKASAKAPSLQLKEIRARVQVVWQNYIISYYIIYSTRARAHTHRSGTIVAPTQFKLSLSSSRLYCINRGIRFLLLQSTLHDAIDQLHFQYSIDIRNILRHDYKSGTCCRNPSLRFRSISSEGDSSWLAENSIFT